MNHPREEWLALESTGDLSWWRATLVRRHTARCAACADRVAEYRCLAGELAALPAPEAPPALARTILAQLPTEVPALPVLSLRSFAAMAAVVVLAVLVTAVRVDMGGQAEQPLRAMAVEDASATTSATVNAVVSETASPSGRQRLVLYTEAEARPVELSAGAGTALAAHSDPRTGALLITGVGIGGLP